MRLRGSGEGLEARRRTALRLLDEGQTEAEVCEFIGCSRSSLFRWKQQRKKDGDEGLVTKTSPGRPCRLSDDNRSRLRSMLDEGAVKHGFRTQLWTCHRVTMLTEETFGITFHPDHVGRLLHQLNYSAQIPERRATERNEDEIAGWWANDWPEIKKKRKSRKPASSSATKQGSN